ncbi:outer membrane beta-barrel protein [Helicobacter pylori]|uniref:Outer membrane protein n=1 Tax=Helicobacter pylori HP260AFii TaxID=1159077 RepID=A0ABC9SAQ8_HELPX|nr:outer membrane beta-barrel protein [Helicobacter pylori]EMG98338.1 outer membrane protein [Helicobacter pylori GAM121Aii]EMH17396.1 outer membrane protein [Helicobacter pylori GAM260ASi]EMH30301.1 outer membrane protein [Helicobacter pylori GAM268Bii]EMH61734.1 outer membrane protein [Helicobacter pylori HP260AFi]EMH67545.1 outer membrane protein [Helicobacter pylori HP260AFii]
MKLKYWLVYLAFIIGLQATDYDNLEEENQQLDEKINNLKRQLTEKGVSPKEMDKDKFEEEYLERTYPKISSKKRKKLLKSFSIADDKSGVFLGGGYAYGELNLSYQGEMLDRYGANAPSAFKNNININAPVSMISAKFGYQKYFVPYFGTRFYGDLLLGGGALKENALKQPVGSFFYVLGAMNTDLLFDMPLDFKTKKHFLGVYAGFGIGLMLYQDKPNQNGRDLVVGGYSSPNFLWKSLIEVDYTFNVGVSLTLYRKHRLEIGTKLPISYLRMGVEEGAIYHNKENDERLLISANNQFKRSSFLLVNYAFIF